MNQVQQSQILKSSLNSHLQSPINNIRDIQQQLQSIDYLPLKSQQGQNSNSGLKEDQKQYNQNEKSTSSSQHQNGQLSLAQNYQQGLKNTNINQVSVSQVSVGTNITTQNGSLNYSVPIMPQNLIASPYNKIQNTSQASIINSSVNLIKSPKYEREQIKTSQLSSSQYNGEEQLKNHIGQLTTEIAILTEKLQKMEMQNQGKKVKQNQQQKKHRKNSSKSSRSSSYSSNSSNSNTSNSSCERDQDETTKRNKKRKKSKQMKKQQENEIERLMQQYLNYVHVDRYQLNLFRDSFISENSFYKLKDSKDYKTLFHKSLIVLITNLEKIKPLVIQSSVLYANNQSQAFKNVNGVQQPSLSHASSTAHLGQIFQNTSASNTSTNGFSQSTNLMLSKLGIINSQSTQNLQNAQDLQQDLKQQKNSNQLKNSIYQKQKDINNLLSSQKNFGNFNSARDPNYSQSEREDFQDWSNQNGNQNSALIRGSHYVPKSAGIGGAGKNSSPNSQKQRIVQSTSYQNEKRSNEISSMDVNLVNHNSQQINSISKHQIQKNFSFMPRDSHLNQVQNQLTEQAQIRESYKINDSQLNGSGMQNSINLLHSRESFGVNIKHNQQISNNLSGQKHQNKGQNKKNNLQLEDIPDDEGQNNQHQNIESAKFKYSQNDFNEKMKQNSNQEYLHYEQQYSNDKYKKDHNLNCQQQYPNQAVQDEYAYEDIPDNYSNNSDRLKNSKGRKKSQNRYETEKKASTLNEIDFDTQSVNSKSSKHIPNDDIGRNRYYTANLQNKNGSDERLRVSQHSRVSIHRDSKNEKSVNEQSIHVCCPHSSTCIHTYGQLKPKKDRQSHFFKTQERDEKIIPDISQIPKRAKPAIQFQKTNFDIITNTIPQITK